MLDRRAAVATVHQAREVNAMMFVIALRDLHQVRFAARAHRIDDFAVMQHASALLSGAHHENANMKAMM